MSGTVRFNGLDPDDVTNERDALTFPAVSMVGLACRRFFALDRALPAAMPIPGERNSSRLSNGEEAWYQPSPTLKGNPEGK
jgi:hypothetical protein